MTTIVPITSITVKPDRQRKEFSDAELVELRDSICTEKGLMCPILVRPGRAEGAYILVAGERRLRAVSTIEHDYTHGTQTVPQGHVPVVVKDFSDEVEEREAELHENIIRVDLNWKEKVEAIESLHQLKLLRNPKHTSGMTAALIDNSDYTSRTGYALSTTKERVENSLLVKPYLSDPEVAKAGSLKDATKIVSRRLEEKALQEIRDYNLKKQQEAQAAPTDVADPLGIATEVVQTLQGLGDIFLEGDMRERLKEIPDGTVHVVVTDPPYGMGVADFGDSGNAALGHDYSEEGFEELHEVLVFELDRICTPSAHVYIFCDFDYFPSIKAMFYAEDADGRRLFPEWTVRRTPLIWTKGNTGNIVDGGMQGYKRSYECILFAHRGRRPCSNVTSDVIPVPMVTKKLHAAQKPVRLYAKLLGMSAIPGDTVLDAFAGCGTIYRAARALGVKVIGIENHELASEMCRLAMERKEVDWEPEL